MYKYRHLQDAFQAVKDTEVSGVTFINTMDEEEFISYRELYSHSMRVLKGLQDLGVKAGQELLFQVDDNRLFLELFWACVMGCIIAVPVTVGINDETRAKVCKVWRKLNDPHFICSDHHAWSGFVDFSESMPEYKPQIEKMKSRLVDINHIKSQDEGVVIETEADQIAFIQFSSGSTGDPKGVVLTHLNLVSNLDGMRNSLSLPEVDTSYRVLSWMPLTHDMGLIAMHLLHTFIHASQYLMRTKLFIQNPLVWISKAHEHRIKSLFSPNFGYKFFLAFYDPDYSYNWDLSCVDFIINGSEPISIDLCERFLEDLEKYGLKKTPMKAVYGLAEGTVGVSLTPSDEQFQYIALDRTSLEVGQAVLISERNASNSILFADVGYPINSCEVRIVDAQRNKLADHLVGHIEIMGLSVTQGYYNDPETTEQIFGNENWLRTGDLGFIREGRLVVVGREKDILFVNGQNVFAHDLERLAEEVDGVKFWNVAACGARNPNNHTEELLLFLGYRSKDLSRFCELADRVRQYILQKSSVYIDHIIPVRSIPKTTSGKIKRYKLGEQYSNGIYETLISEMEVIKYGELKTENTTGKLIHLCSDIFGRQMDPQDLFQEMGGNSLILTKVADGLLKKYGIEIAVTDLYKYPTISKLSEFINQDSRQSYSSVGLPKDYFAKVAHSSLTLEASLDNETYACLRTMAANTQMNSKEILLSLYLYLLKEISGETVIQVQVAVTEDRFVSLDIDFTDLETLESLLSTVKTELEVRSESSSYAYSHTERYENEPDDLRIVAMVILQPVQTKYRDMNGVFDLVLEYVEKDDQMELLMELNQSHFNERKLKELFTQYMMLVSDVVESYKTSV